MEIDLINSTTIYLGTGSTMECIQNQCEYIWFSLMPVQEQWL